MNLNYTCDKLDAAVQTLKEGTNEPRFRLANAYLSQLRELKAEDFPVELRADFKRVIDEMAKMAPSGNEDALKSSMERVRPEKVDDLTKQICLLQERTQVIRHEDDSRTLQ